MVTHQAVVLHDELAGRRGLGGRHFVPDAELHPDDLRRTLDRLIDDRRDIRGRAEDVDRVVRDRDCVQGGVGLLAEDLRRRRIHREDPVPMLLHVLRDPVRILERVFRTSDDRNRSNARQDLSDRRVIRHVKASPRKSRVSLKVSSGSVGGSNPSTTAPDSTSPRPRA